MTRDETKRRLGELAHEYPVTHTRMSNPACTNNIVTVGLILHFYPSSQAHGLVDKALLRSSGCELRNIHCTGTQALIEGDVNSTRRLTPWFAGV